ncbi:MAG TPA: porin [Gemmatimonadales bacterium]|nr:porin [Gemmatimonadales bacterium]
MIKRMGAAVPLLVAVICSQLAAQGPTGVRFDGYLQPRSEMTDDSAVFFLRRARVGLHGQATPWAQYRVLTEWRSGATSTVSLLDAYVQLTDRRWTFILGQSKTPFSRGFLQDEHATEMPELPMVVDALAPSRDIGAKAEFRGVRRVVLQGGVFNGEGPNRTTNNNRSLLLLARGVVTLQGGFEIGAAGGMEDNEDYLGFEAAYNRRDIQLRGEYIQRKVGAGAGITAVGWYGFGGWMQRRGRMQLVGRVEQFDPNDNTAGDRLMAFTGGAQWLLRGETVKVQTTYTVVNEETGSIPNNRAVAQLQLRF